MGRVGYQFCSIYGGFFLFSFLPIVVLSGPFFFFFLNQVMCPKSVSQLKRVGCLLLGGVLYTCIVHFSNMRHNGLLFLGLMCEYA